MVKRITISAYAVLGKVRSIVLPALRKIRGISAEDLGRRHESRVSIWSPSQLTVQPPSQLAPQQTSQQPVSQSSSQPASKLTSRPARQPAGNPAMQPSSQPASQPAAQSDPKAMQTVRGGSAEVTAKDMKV